MPFSFLPTLIFILITFMTSLNVTTTFTTTTTITSILTTPSLTSSSAFERQRQEWLTIDPFNNSLNEKQITIQPSTYQSLYTSLILNSKPVKRQVHLSLALVLKIIEAGWKNEGIWPSKEEETLDKNNINNNQKPGFSETQFTTSTSASKKEHLSNHEKNEL